MPILTPTEIHAADLVIGDRTDHVEPGRYSTVTSIRPIGRMLSVTTSDGWFWSIDPTALIRVAR